jgi:hypothetical protein
VFNGNRFNRTAATAPFFNYLAPSECADEKMVSRVGIEPTTRRLRGAPKRQPIAADLGNTGSAFSFESRLGLRTAACFGIRCTNLHTPSHGARAIEAPGELVDVFTIATLFRAPHSIIQRPLRRRRDVARRVAADGSGSLGKMTFALTLLCGKSFRLSAHVPGSIPLGFSQSAFSRSDLYGRLGCSGTWA